MNFKTTKLILTGLLFIFALVSCDKNDEILNQQNTNTNLGYTTENGYFKFQSSKEYKALANKLSKMTNKELDEWNKSLPFKSLETNYQENNVERHIFIENDSNSIICKLNTNRLAARSASLFNENGILVINDTIYKIKGEYLFKITNNDFQALKKIESDSNIGSANITKELHTISLNNTNTAAIFSGKQLTKNNISDQSLMYYINSKRREFMTYDAYYEPSDGNIHLDLDGHFQRKVLFWLTPTGDEFVYAQFLLNGTWAGQTVNWISPITYGQGHAEFKFLVGNPFNIPFDLNLTYKYRKNGGTAYFGSWNSGNMTTTEASIQYRIYPTQF